MDATSSQPLNKLKMQKRPDSLKIELLTIPEDRVNVTYENDINQDQVNLGFKNLSFSVKEGVFHRSRRKILRQVSGDFYSGDLTAIMGPSGCGKTSLMNILAGYTTKDVTGKLLVNDEIRHHEKFKKRSCYIMQNDNLQPLLTVYEAMMIAARLKLSTGISTKDKKVRIKDILEAIGLWSSCKIRTDALSGGQKKRLSIALELLKNPEVMLFDEPTSGLDSSTSKQCLMLLKQLASEGKTIICTIHQPSASLFELFDHLYAISEGRCIYQGSIKGMLPYFEEQGLICPPYHNPADYLLEVAAGEHGPHVEDLVIKSENGQCQDWRRRQRDTIQFQSFDHIDQMMKNGLVTPVKAPPPMFRSTGVQTESQRKLECCTRNYPTSFCNEMHVLLKRSYLTLSRDRTLTYSRILTHLFVGLFIGTLYFGIGGDAKHMLNNANYLFYTVMFLMLTSFNCVTLTFPLEMPVIIKEHFNGWYSVNSYYLSVIISDFPVSIISTVLYVTITFFMTGQPFEYFRMTYFLIICILISFVAQSFGLLIGASLDLKSGIILGPICFLPFTIFSGFFVQLNDAHPSMRWIFHISYLKYGFEGLMLSIFGYNREKLPCSEDYCHFVYPKKFLNQLDMDDAVYSNCIYFLIGLLIVIRVATYFILLSRVRRYGYFVLLISSIITRPLGVMCSALGVIALWEVLAMFETLCKCLVAN